MLILFPKVLTGFCRLVVSAYLTVRYSVIWSANGRNVLYWNQDRPLGIESTKGFWHYIAKYSFFSINVAPTL